MFRVYNPVSAEEQSKAEAILAALLEKGLKMHHLERMLHSTCIQGIARGRLRIPRETLDRIIGLGETYGIVTKRNKDQQS